MKRVLLIAFKDLRLLGRDHAALFWVVFFPVLFGAFFGLIFSGQDNKPRDIGVGIVVEQQSPMTERLVASLRKSRSLKPELLSHSEAVSRIQKGSLATAVIIRKGFGEDLGRMFSGDAGLEVISDPSRAAESGMVQGMLTQAAFETISSQFTDPTAMKAHLAKLSTSLNSATSLSASQKLALKTLYGSLDTFLDSAKEQRLTGGEFNFSPVKQTQISASISQSPSYFSVSFAQAILWGMMGCAASFGISLAQERTTGTLQRLRIAPLRPTYLLAGKGLACFLTCMAVSALLVLLARVFFHLQVKEPLMLLLGVAACAFCFVGVMMFVSTLGRTEQAVGGAGWALLLLFGMLGGAMVPSFIMPPWLRSCGNLSPVRWGILAIEGAVWRGFSLGQMMQPVLVLVLGGSLFFAVAIARLRGRGDN